MAAYRGKRGGPAREREANEKRERGIERRGGGRESQACARRRTYASLTDHLVLISTLSWG